MSIKTIHAQDIMRFGDEQAEIAQILIPEMREVDHTKLAVVIATCIDNVLSSGEFGTEKYLIVKSKTKKS